MDLVAVILFLTLTYIRPHEWIHLFSSLRLTAFSLVFAILATLMRQRKFEFKDLFKTPHDWLMVIYFAWIILSAPSIMTAWQNVYAYLVYYLVTVQALSSLKRIQLFLNWWAAVILAVAALAVMSEHGIDLMGSSDITHGPMKGRLVLNISIFNNPNALGHGLVPVVVMLYFICIWKRPIFSRIVAIPLLVLPMYALYLTLSKGAFLSMFVGILMVFTFGRHKITQILIITLACTVGWGAMHLLPRMNELDKTQKDQAIQGRVQAFRFGLNAMQHLPRGLGYGKFESEFSKANHFFKAPHSAYVEVGSESGRTGLFLFLGLIYCAMRTLVTAQTHSVEEERIRRILFCTVVTYIVSAWMVDFAWRASFFMMCGAVAAFHRHLLGLDQATEPEPEIQPLPAVGTREVLRRWEPIFPAPVPAMAGGAFPMTQASGIGAAPQIVTVNPVPAEPVPQGITWNRIGWVDAAMIFALCVVFIRIWNYIIHHV